MVRAPSVAENGAKRSGRSGGQELADHSGDELMCPPVV